MKKGLVTKIDKDFILVMTDQMTVEKIKPIDGVQVGSQVEYSRKDIYRGFKQFNYRRASSFLALILVLVVSSILLIGRNADREVYAVVSVDINPSLELHINSDLEVIAHRSFTIETDRILSNELKGMLLEDALRLIFLRAQESDFLTGQGLILISTATVADKVREDIRVEDEIKSFMLAHKSKFRFIYVETKAEDYRDDKDATIGRQTLMSMIEESDVPITSTVETLIEAALDESLDTLEPVELIDEDKTIKIKLIDKSSQSKPTNQLKQPDNDGDIDQKKSLQQQIKTSRTLIDDYNKEKSDIEDRYATITTTIDQINDDISNLDLESSPLKTQLSSLKAEASTAYDTADSKYTDDIDALEASRSEAIEDVNKILKISQNSYDNAKLQYDSVKAHYDSVVASLEESANVQKAAEDDVNQKQVIYDEAVDELNTLQNQYKLTPGTQDYLIKLEEAEDEVETAKADLDAAIIQKKQADADVDTAVQLAIEARETLKISETNLADAESSLSETKISVQNQTININEEYDAKIASLKQDKDSYFSQYYRLQKDIDAIEATLSALTDTKESKTLEADSLEQELLDLSAKLEDLAKNIEYEENNIIELENQLDNLK